MFRLRNEFCIICLDVRKSPVCELTFREALQFFTYVNSAFDFCNNIGFTGKWLIMSVSEFAYTYLENGHCTCSTR